MAAAAGPFVRIKIRVPEAYLIVRMYDTTRPALLVLDADGHRVDSIKLLGAKPAEVAQRLVEAQRAPARERFVLDGPDATKLGGTRKGDRWVVWAPLGKHTPQTLAAKGYTVHHPVPVKRDGKTVFVPRLLVHAAEDLESRTYALPAVPKGGTGAAVAMAPFSVDGVVSVFPDIFAEWQIVVARKGTDWARVKAAFVAKGVAATERR